jgi:ABC-type nitrate/sulfonate/bicarbonate transport system substrate-binding protein
MRKRILLIFTCAQILAAGAGFVNAQTLKTIRFMTTTLGASILPYVAADRLGFYREEGIRVEIIRATTSTSIQAVLGGSADYLKHGSAIGAILGGVPLKVIAVDTDRSPQYIVAKPEIGSLKELIGRTMGIDDIAGAANWVVRETLLKNGIPIDKINWRRIGSPELRLQALVAGVVDAVPLNFGLAGKARENRFRAIAYTGDFATDIQLLAAVPAERIDKSPAEIHKFIKPTLKARLFQFSNPDEAYKLFSELEGISDSAFARESFEERRTRSSTEARMGLLSEDTMTESINAWKGQMTLANRQIKLVGRPEDVYDFTFVRRALQEIRNEGFDPKKYRYLGKK